MKFLPENDHKKILLIFDANFKVSEHFCEKINLLITKNSKILWGFLEKSSLISENKIFKCIVFMRNFIRVFYENLLVISVFVGFRNSNRHPNTFHSFTVINL